MKQNLLIMLCVTCCFQSYAQFSGKGAGTSDDPYQITNADELFEIRNALSASYKLMNDINLTEWIADNNPTQGWTPIYDFSGTFDGNGKKIYGLYVNRSNTDNVGLFGTIIGGEVHSFSLEHPIVIGKDNVGTIAGFFGGYFQYSDDSGMKKLAKLHNITIINPKVVGNNHIGGVIGIHGKNSTISAETAIDDFERLSVINPTVNGNKYIGGLIGSFPIESRGFNRQRYNIVVGGKINGEEEIGGLIGRSDACSESFNKELIICSNYCSAYVNGKKNVGGIIGTVFQGFYRNYYNHEWNIKTSIVDNCFAGILHSVERAGGIVSVATNIPSNNTSSLRLGYNKLNICRNIDAGNVYSKEGASGIFGVLESSTNSAEYNDLTIAGNIFCGDSLVSYDKNSSIYRISEIEGSNNFALTTSKLVVYDDAYNISVENAQQGLGYGKKTLTKKTTYEGLGFDFNNNWAIVEGESYPYIITQSMPPKNITFTSGTSGIISGTAEMENKNLICNGNVYITIGDDFYEGIITNGKWSVELGNVKEGAEARVTVMVDGMMPSILTSAIAENEHGAEDLINLEVDVTDITSMSDAIYIEPVTSLSGSEISVDIKLKNAQEATAYLFNLVLPEGVAVAQDESNRFIDVLSDRHVDHMRTFNSKGNNVYSLSALSGNSESLTGNEGTIRTLKLKIADNMAEGTYAISIQNAQYSLLNGTLLEMPETVTSLTVQDYVLGDVSGNGQIDIGDAVSIVNYLVGKPSQSFSVSAADTNHNGQIDIGDAVTIVNFLVGKIDAFTNNK